MRTKHVKVLVAPLDWGLGHATRCIPVIDELIHQGCEVVVGGSGIGMGLLQARFPKLLFVTLPSYGITYPRKGGMALHIVLQLPKILRVIKAEKKKVEEIVHDHQITHVISDNRYGLYNNKVPSVFMTHQVHVSSGTGLTLFDELLFFIHRIMMERFDRIWIVDKSPKERLAGRLSSSRGLRKPFDFIGLLSRFCRPNQQPGKIAQPTYKRVAILSGPEPQRGLLEEKLTLFFKESGEPCLIVRGTGGQDKHRFGQLDLLDSISDQKLLELLHPETILYSRPGFSTLMDLAFLQHQKVVFIPTPGQTEQEYLGKLMHEQFGYTCMKQNSNFATQEAHNGRKLPHTSSQQLENAIYKLLQIN